MLYLRLFSSSVEIIGATPKKFPLPSPPSLIQLLEHSLRQAQQILKGILNEQKDKRTPKLSECTENKSC
jgi:hypothetical protein